MTIEEKAKAYDEALEKAKVHIDSKGIGDTVDLCKDLFPQLQESEDERIRKCILNGMKYLQKQGKTSFYEVPMNDVIAYLENQKEQKSVKENEEDEFYLDAIINVIDRETARYPKGSAIEDFNNDLINWLKRQDLQSKIEWTKEDEQDLNHIRCILDDCYAYGKHDLSKVDRDNLMQFLRSLRPFDKLTEEKSTIIKTIMSILSDAEFNGYISIDTLKVCNDFLKSLYS